MAFTNSYTKAEKDLLIQEMGHPITGKDFEAFVELWPGLFQGQKRSAYGLYKQMKRLAKANDLQPIFESIPFLHRNRKGRDRSKERSAKKPSGRNRIRLQIEGIVHKEMQICINRIIRSVKDLTKQVVNENQELKKEILELRPYKTTVEQHFRKDLSKR